MSHLDSELMKENECDSACSFHFGLPYSKFDDKPKKELIQRLALQLIQVDSELEDCPNAMVITLAKKIKAEKVPESELRLKIETAVETFFKPAVYHDCFTDPTALIAPNGTCNPEEKKLPPPPPSPVLEMLEKVFPEPFSGVIQKLIPPGGSVVQANKKDAEVTISYEEARKTESLTISQDCPNAWNKAEGMVLSTGNTVKLTHKSGEKCIQIDGLKGTRGVTGNIVEMSYIENYNGSGEARISIKGTKAFFSAIKAFTCNVFGDTFQNVQWT